MSLKLANSTKNRYLGTWRRLFSLAIEEGWLRDNPANKVTMLKVSDLRDRVCSEEEEGRLFEACEKEPLKTRAPHLKSVLIMAIQTGMRLSEILSMRWEHVDFEHDRIYLPKTKSGKPQNVPMGRTVANLLQVLRRHHEGEFVFVNPQTGKPITQIQNSFKKACQEAKKEGEAVGIEGLRFHDLRATCATRMLQKSVYHGG